MILRKCWSLYEKKLTLTNGQAVTALISELKNTSKIYVMLYLNGALVCIKGEGSLFSDTFWEAFGLVEYDTTDESPFEEVQSSSDLASYKASLIK